MTKAVRLYFYLRVHFLNEFFRFVVWLSIFVVLPNAEYLGETNIRAKRSFENNVENVVCHKTCVMYWNYSKIYNN